MKTRVWEKKVLGEPGYDLQQCVDKAVAIMLEDLEGFEEVTVDKASEVKKELF